MSDTDKFWQRADDVPKSLDGLHEHAEGHGRPAGHREKHVDQGPLFVASEFLKPDDGVQCDRSDDYTDTRNGHSDPLEDAFFSHEWKEIFIAEVLCQIE